MNNRYKLISGLFACGIGVACIIASLDYKIGELRNMGAGYYPLLLGIITTVLGLLVILLPESDVDRENEIRYEAVKLELKRHVRPWLSITIGLVLFILIGNYGGFIPATFILILVSAFGDRENSLLTSLVLAVVSSIFSVIVFYYGMQIQFPLWQWG